MGLLFETWFKPAPQVPSMGKGLLPQLLNENIRVPRGVPARFPLRGLHRGLSKAAARHRSTASGRRNLNP
jgi:hypothetical protein